MLYYEKITNEKAKEWVLLIHGLGGSTKTWKYQINSLKDKYNLILVDLDGHGNSKIDKSKTLYKPNQAAKSIYYILFKEHIKQVHIISLSLGTLVALEFTRLYPQKVSSIVLAGCIINLDKKRKFLLNIVDVIKYILPTKPMYKIFANIIMPRKNHKKSREIFIRESLKMNNKSFKLWINSLKQSQSIFYKYIKTLNQYHIPTLFISGKEDYMFLKGIKNLHYKLKSFNLKIFEKCGHVCSIEKSELFNKCILKFLKTI